MTVAGLEESIAVARALGHPARLRTLAMLAGGELCVCQITEVLELAPSTVSAHLRELRRAGLTRERKVGRYVYVSLADDHTARSWIATALVSLEGDPQVGEDARLVEELRRLPVEDLCRLGYEKATARHRRLERNQRRSAHDPISATRWEAP